MMMDPHQALKNGHFFADVRLRTTLMSFNIAKKFNFCTIKNPPMFFRIFCAYFNVVIPLTNRTKQPFSEHQR